MHLNVNKITLTIKSILIIVNYQIRILKTFLLYGISKLLLNKHIDPHKIITMSAHSLFISATDTKTVLILNVQSTTKLNSTNFPAWMVQFNALLIDYDLFGFVDGTKPSPAADHVDYNY